jgi:AcrR family transcriptional regulator
MPVTRAKNAVAAVKPVKSAKPIKPKLKAIPTKKSPASAAAKGGPTRPVRSRRSPDEVTARILEAAIFEFSEHGFSGARVDQISKRAKTVDRMLYYYFGNKERLYEAVLEHVYENMMDAQRAFVFADVDPVAGMREVIAHSWEHYLAHPELVRLLMSENLLRGKYIQKSTKIRKFSHPLLETVRDLLESGKKKKLFKSDLNPEIVLLTIMSLAYFFNSNFYTCEHWLGPVMIGQERRDQWLEHISNVVLDYVMLPKKAAR